MTKKNIFHGIEVAYSVVQHWRTYKGFDHFVFQQAIYNTDVGDFTLIAYARTADLKVLNDGKAIGTTPLKVHAFTGTKLDIEFANMRLNHTQLDGLYPHGALDTPLLVYPAGNSDPNHTPYYKNTAYVQYVAWTESETMAGPPVPIDPSPPHGS